MSIVQDLKNAIQGKSAGTDTTYKFIKELWDKCDNQEKHTRTCYEYWEGELVNKLVATAYFPDQKKTNGNIVKSIVETRLKSTLDAQFTTAVVPDLGSFFSLDTIKDARAIADVYNDGLKAIYKDNNIDVTDEKVCRAGEICGLGASQVEWDVWSRPDGRINIEQIEPIDIRWNRGAKQGDIQVIGYKLKKCPAYFKNRYAKKDDGSYDEDLCKKIDEISVDEVTNKQHIQKGDVINYINADNSTAGRAYAEAGTDGIQGSRIAEVVVLYLTDDSVYAPEEKDDNELQAQKEEFKRVFPNGRKIIFSTNDNKKMVLVDEPLGEEFKCLGNMDVYNPTVYKDLNGKSIVDDIAPIQDRINGLYKKYREKVQGDFDTVIVDTDLGLAENAFVRGAITQVDDYGTKNKAISELMTNNGIEKAKMLLDAIEQLGRQAYQLARINETMVAGARQTGTTSADQVEALQESPMADIRSQQRNFANYKIAQAEKCLMLMSSKYTNQRIIQLSAGQQDGANLARIGADGIELLKEVDGVISVIKTIKRPADLKLRVECIAGTEIPRSRKEMATLVDEIAASPVLQSGDIDMIEMYLEAKDFPQRHAFIKLLKKKQEKKSKQKFTIMNVLSNPVIGKNAADILNALSKGGFSTAISQMLQQIGLDGSVDTLTTAPIQAITSKSDVKDTVDTTPGKVASSDPTDINGRQIAGEILDREHK